MVDLRNPSKVWFWPFWFPWFWYFSSLWFIGLQKLFAFVFFALCFVGCPLRVKILSSAYSVCCGRINSDWSIFQ